MRNPDLNQILVHPDGVVVPELEPIYQNRLQHDPTDLDRARELAEDAETLRLGVFYRNASIPCYDEVRQVRARTATEKLSLLEEELDRYAV